MRSETDSIVSIGIMAYNEEANIGRLIQTILREKFASAILNEVIVVASGCTDNTVNIVEFYAKRDPRVKLVLQKNREGKASAINLFLSQASGDIVILESGDTLPEKDTLEKLIFPLRKHSTGMTGAKPLPVNDRDTFMGFVVHLMWALHHKISLGQPKMGELVAFRKLFNAIPADTAVDEACIEAMVKQKGYNIVYVPDAVVHNKGPETMADFIKQRRRISAGHKHLEDTYGHTVSTKNPIHIFKQIVQLHQWGLKGTLWTLGAIGMEFAGRCMGYYDFFIKKKNPFIWSIAASTKRLD